jgi:triosephosphate isomerase
MRKIIIAGNWKMNKTLEEGFDLAEELKNKVGKELPENVQMIIIPPVTHTKILSKALENSKIEVGAQNCHEEEEGAFTGDISVNMLQSVGAKYVIVGHSERRKFHKEDNKLLAKKVKKVLEKE